MNWKRVGDTAVSVFCRFAGTAIEHASDVILRNADDEYMYKLDKIEKNSKSLEQKEWAKEKKNSVANASKAKAMARELKKVKNMDDYKNL